MKSTGLFPSFYSRKRAVRRGLAISALAVCAIVASGCSMSLGSLGGDDAEEMVTGSIPAPVTAPVSPVSSAPLPPPPGTAVDSATILPSAGTQTAEADADTMSDHDWGYARGALSLALTGDNSGPPVPWANPDTGSRGNFAASAPAMAEGGSTCREFRATRTEQGREVRLLGRACKDATGQWNIAETRREPVAL
jgi:surface antigen